MLRSAHLCTKPHPSDTFVNLLHVVPMSLAACAVCLCVVTASLAGQTGLDDRPVLSAPPTATNSLPAVCVRFNALNTRIRDNRINRTTARVELQRLLAELREGYYRAGGSDYPASEWIFPLAGYGAGAIGGGKQHGYTSRGYDFFSGNRHGGHPSYDIFIRDRNQDGLDDRSGRPVSVRSLTGGVVVALENEWEPGSRLKGGKYVWVFDPANDLLVYYAHNADLNVTLGEIVRPGDMLSVVGRSGFNAAKRRSPTHLHLTVLRVQGGKVEPVKAFQMLKGARLFPGRP